MADEDTVPMGARSDERTDRGDVRPDMPGETRRSDEVRSDDARPGERDDTSGNRFVGSGSLMEAIRLSETLEPRNPRERETADELKQVGQKINELRMQGISEQEIQQTLGSLPANADPIMAAQDALAKLNELQKQEEKEATERAAQERAEGEKREKETADFYKTVGAAVGVAKYLDEPLEGVGRDIKDPSARGMIGKIAKLFDLEPNNPLHSSNLPSMPDGVNKQQAMNYGMMALTVINPMTAIALTNAAHFVETVPGLSAPGMQQQQGQTVPGK